MRKVGPPAEEFGSNGGTVGPDRGLLLWVEANLAEQRHIFERLEDFSPEVIFHVDGIRRAILEGGFDHIAMEMPNAGYNERRRVWLANYHH